ncbi:hypothetical protein C8R44DRAFT_895758 [Mycena epipterygia]|nr:hypothetical protein C8R44DRAFT_895758 [Mycena epipterygia]
MMFNPCWKLPPSYDWTQGRRAAHLCLEPWIPDLEAIVACILPALPFTFALPAAFPAPNEIGVFSAKVQCLEAASIPDPVAGLLFFNPAKVRMHDVSDWQMQLLVVLRGEASAKAAHICVVLSMDALSWGACRRSPLENESCPCGAYG